MNQTSLEKMIGHFLEEDITIREFNFWFSTAMWEVDSDLRNRVALLLAEYSNGHRTEEELRGLLRTEKYITR